MSVRCGYCGPGNNIPPGYDYLENRNVCLRKGFGAGSSGERRKWQRKLGLRIDPPYVSPCPKRDRSLIRRVRNRNRDLSSRSPSYNSRSRSRTRSIRRNRRSRSRTRSIRRNRRGRTRSRSYN